MARRGCPPDFQRRVIDLVEGGRKVVEREAGVVHTFVFTWLPASILVYALWV